MLSEISLNSMREEQDKLSLDSNYSMKEKLDQNRKQVTIFLLLTFLVCCLLGVSSYFLATTVTKYFQVISFLFLGFLHVRILSESLSILTNSEKQTYTALLATAILLMLIVMQFITETNGWFIAVAGACSFVLPYTINRLWELFLQLSFSTIKHWEYHKDLPLQKSTIFLSSMPIRFAVQIEHFGNIEHRISFRAPVKMKLGLIFFHMVQDQNHNGGTPIELIDESKHSYQWIFFTNRFGMIKYLDPELTLIENGIRENNLVIAKRLSVNPDELISIEKTLN